MQLVTPTELTGKGGLYRRGTDVRNQCCQSEPKKKRLNPQLGEGERYARQKRVELGRDYELWLPVILQSLLQQG